MEDSPFGWRVGFAPCVAVFAFACESDVPDVAPAPGTPPLGAEPRRHRLGERAAAAHYAMTTFNSEQCKVEPYFEPAKGRIKLGVEVEIVGTHATMEVPINPFYAALVDHDGVRYESTLAGCQPTLEAIVAKGGASRRGWVSFEIPSTARDLELIYEPIVIGGGREALHFSLGR